MARGRGNSKRDSSRTSAPKDPDDHRPASPANGVPELLRRALTFGLSGFFTTNEAVRRALTEAWFSDTAVATAAVRAGDGHVLDTSHVIFPNGAITLVLILAESHLAIHTWPEEDLVAVDLFTCGAIDADRVVTELITGLRLSGTRVQQVRRGAGR